MTMKRIIWVVVVAAVVGLAAWGLSQVHAPQGTGQSTGVATSTFAESGRQYDISVQYPAVPQGELAVIKSALQPAVDDFRQTVQGLTAEDMPSLADHKLAFDATYDEYGSTNFDSFVYTIYEDTGGAHPNGTFQTFVFNKQGDLVKLGDLFVSTSTNSHADYLNQIAGIATADIEQQMRERLGGDPSRSLFEEGLAPTEANYSTFIIDGDNLHFYFPPYQVAAYAMGSFEVKIPLSKFKDILKPGVM